MAVAFDPRQQHSVRAAPAASVRAVHNHGLVCINKLSRRKANLQINLPSTQEEKVRVQLRDLMTKDDGQWGLDANG